MADVRKIVNDLFSRVPDGNYYAAYFAARVAVLLPISLIAGGAAYLSMGSPFALIVIPLAGVFAFLSLAILLPPIYYGMLQKSLVELGFGGKLSSNVYPVKDALRIFALNILIFLTYLFNWLDKRVLAAQLICYVMLILPLGILLAAFFAGGDTAAAFANIFSSIFRIFLGVVASAIGILLVYTGTRISLAPQIYISRKDSSITGSIKESYKMTEKRFVELFMYLNIPAITTQYLLSLSVGILVFLSIFSLVSGAPSISAIAGQALIFATAGILLSILLLIIFHFMEVFSSIVNARIFQIFRSSKAEELWPNREERKEPRAKTSAPKKAKAGGSSKPKAKYGAKKPPAGSAGKAPRKKK